MVELRVLLYHQSVSSKNGSPRTMAVLAVLLGAILATATALPALLLQPNVTLLQASNATDTSRDPLSSRKILLAFTALGESIPELEVNQTFAAAEKSIHELIDRRPEDRITDDRFEYRSQHGDMLILIATNMGEEITWAELGRVLESLYRFMTGGVGVPDAHYQSLEFKIQVLPVVDVGFGLVWYFPPSTDSTQKRALLPPSTSAAEGASLLRRNVTSLSLDRNAKDEGILYPIPRTALLLEFYFLGMPLPPDLVRSTVQGALAKVRPEMNDGHDNDPIGGSFQHITQSRLSGDTRLAVSIFTYAYPKMTWRQLFDVLFGLFQFATSFGDNGGPEHYQILGFRIFHDELGKLGVGSISYYESRKADVTKRTQDRLRSLGTETLSLQGDPKALQLYRPNTSDPRQLIDMGMVTSISSDTNAPSVTWPIVGTDIELTFTFFGDPIPTLEASSTIIGAQFYIAPVLQQEPDAHIANNYFRYQSDDGLVVITIIPYGNRYITWRQLNYILGGLLQFCAEHHSQVLVFEIDIGEQGRVGFTTFLYAHVNPPPSVVVKRASNGSRSGNTTLVPYTGASLAFSILYPIHGTPITLVITSFGHLIPPLELGAGLTNALSKIGRSVATDTNVAIPENRYWYRDNVSRLWFVVLSMSSRHFITWQQLSWTLAGLLQWMKGDHCRELSFEIKNKGEGMIGFGSLGHDPLPAGSPPGMTKMEKRSELQLMNTTLLSPLTNDECISISDTGLELCIGQFGDPIPALQVNILFSRIFSLLPSSEERMPTTLYMARTPASPITGRTLLEVEWERSSGMKFNQLYRVLHGLEVYLLGAGSGPNARPHLQSSTFQIKAAGLVIGEGHIWFDPGRHKVEKRVLGNDDSILRYTANTTSALQSVGAKAPYSFPVVDTPITLSFYYFSRSLPGFGIQAISTLRSALAKIAPEVERSGYIPITDNLFRYSKRFGHMKIILQVKTSLVVGHTISWRTLDSVLDGLAWFMQRDPDTASPCNQGSKFWITETEIGVIGQGDLWWSISTGGLEERANIASSATPPHNTSLALPTDPFAFPVTGTDITLMMVFIARPIEGVGREISMLLLDAVHQIQSLADQHPDSPITNNFFEARKTYDTPVGKLIIRVRTHEAEDLTWQDLRNTLEGLGGFYIHDPATGDYRDWGTRFQVNKAGIGTIGQGIVIFVGHTFAKRTPAVIEPSHSNFSRVSVPELGDPTHYPIPGTPLELIARCTGRVIVNFGRDVSYVIAGARLKIHEHVEQEADAQIPDNRYYYSETYAGESRMAIAIYAFSDYGISWIDLDGFLLGLTNFMIGDSRSGLTGHNQGATFAVNKNGAGKIAVGALWASINQPSGSKRVIPSTLSSTSDKAFPETSNTTLSFSPPNNPSTTIPAAFTADPPFPIPFKIQDTSLNLSITSFGPTIPHALIQSLFVGAMSDIYPNVVARANDPIGMPYYFWKFSSGAGELVNIGVHNFRSQWVTWKQLNETLGGVKEFMEGEVARERAIGFDILDVGRTGRLVGKGLVHYSSYLGVD